jgi:hypothetical protein
MFRIAKRSFTSSTRVLFAAADVAPSSSMTLNFCTPNTSLFAGKTVDKVILPGKYLIKQFKIIKNI